VLKIQLTDKIGDIVAACPTTAEVFKKYNIDFCCGGDRPLVSALREQHLDQEEVVSALEAACAAAARSREKYVDWRQAPLNDLIDHIVATHHGYLRRVLPELSVLTTRILQVHGDGHEELFTVHRLFHTLKTELEQHRTKEELRLFPLIEEYEKDPTPEKLAKIRELIAELEAEHDAAGGLLKELRAVTDDYAVPADACLSYRLTYEKLQELESDLFQHIHLENNVLHPRLREAAVGN